MSLKAGDAFPADVVFQYIPWTPETADAKACGMPVDYNASSEWADKKVVLFSVPGAFTPTCSVNHVPGYIQNLPQLKQKGVDVVAVIASNDPFVMSAWGKVNEVKGDDLLFLSDPDARFSSSIGWANGPRTGRYALVVDHGKVDLVIASPKGGEAPLDPGSVKKFENDPVSTKFLNEQEALWKKTETLADFRDRVHEFDAIFYVGGHGPMYDLHYDATSLALIQSFAAAKKPVAAVCHGPTVFVRAVTPDGTPLLAGATVTGFSNLEEDQVGMTPLMPYMLEDELQRVTGGGFVKAADPWAEKVVVSQTAGTGATLITGQNPASATGVGKEILKALGL